MVYQWKVKGLFKANATKCKAELDKIGGKMSNKDIVDFAMANKNSELSKCFVWDIEKAAMRDWLNTAGEIRRSIVIPPLVETEDVEPIRAFEQDKSGAYRDISEAINDNSFKQDILSGIRREIDQMERKAITCKRFFKSPGDFIKAMKAARKAI